MLTAFERSLHGHRVRGHPRFRTVHRSRSQGSGTESAPGSGHTPLSRYGSLDLGPGTTTTRPCLDMRPPGPTRRQRGTASCDPRTSTDQSGQSAVPAGSRIRRPCIAGRGIPSRDRGVCRNGLLRGTGSSSSAARRESMETDAVPADLDTTAALRVRATGTVRVGDRNFAVPPRAHRLQAHRKITASATATNRTPASTPAAVLTATPTPTRAAGHTVQHPQPE